MSQNDSTVAPPPAVCALPTAVRIEMVAESGYDLEFALEIGEAAVS